ncbi:hypothetical protein [Sphaerisporangium rhizosphaerae]|uniref:Uncharacterized protein n=1 Tax=Sphaerisporangium rhizosphaerae TaxID=2269375 RepID=A0ABW2P0C8_9ACTN
MNPAATALTDQAEAAAMHSLTALATIAPTVNGTIGARLPGPISLRFLARLEAGLLGGAIGFCDHLSATAPRPAFWSPWAAGKVRCAPCAGRAYTRIKGTTEDRRCDRCRRRMTVTNSLAWQLPAVVLTLPGGAARAIPPMQVHLGLCSACRHVDTEGDDRP